MRPPPKLSRPGASTHSANGATMRSEQGLRLEARQALDKPALHPLDAGAAAFSCHATQELAMKNEALMELDGLVGDWNLTLSDTSFLESREAEVRGSARIEWLGVLVMLSDAWDLAIGRSDANGQ
jgi:hypothetical protein